MSQTAASAQVLQARIDVIRGAALTCPASRRASTNWSRKPRCRGSGTDQARARVKSRELDSLRKDGRGLGQPASTGGRSN